MVKPVKQVLIERDGFGEQEAEERVQEVQSQIHDLIATPGTTLMDIEQVIEDEFGLEPDYVVEFLN